MKKDLDILYKVINSQYKEQLQTIISSLDEPCIILDLFELKSLINPEKFDFPNVEVGEIALENN